MIVVKVVSAEMQDRSFSLEAGSFTVGSSLDCDVVLLDLPVQSQHFMLHVQSGAVEVVKIAEGPLEIERSSKGRESLHVGGRVVWGVDDKLWISGMCLQLQGVASERATARRVSRYLKRSDVPRLGLVLASACMLVIPFLGAHRSSAGGEQGPQVPAPTATQGDLSSETAVRRSLAEVNVRYENLKLVSGTWSATLRVADETGRSDAERKVRSLPFSFRAEILVDEQLKRAAALVLSHTLTSAQIVSMANGVLTVTLPSGEGKAGYDTFRALRSDVPGLVTVRFKSASSAELDQIRGAIAGVWLGKYPYVLLNDSTVVRPGNQLAEKAVLVSIDSDFITVNVHGSEQKVFIK
ncbi:hypothetical protein [Ensifer sp. SL37]|uniref:hypothetical protein n=1 Tax=Ensifer sp. SL37 TaxID=2995137 RepID=UPI0022748843|nr:hypothetical protein [Ensifer sp. SL37]MCY1740494.1 hypothetical protein [Ensifer sp. SL37]